MASHRVSPIYVGIGSNLDRPIRQVLNAIQRLCALSWVDSFRVSSLYRSVPWGVTDQPDYINAVARLSSTLPPLALLGYLQEIENQQGRQRAIRWGARTLDLDLLLYDNQVHDSVELQLPHPEIANRNFVLVPLYELAPDLTLPNGGTLATLMADCNTTDLTPYVSTDYTKSNT